MRGEQRAVARLLFGGQRGERIDVQLSMAEIELITGLESCRAREHVVRGERSLPGQLRGRRAQRAFGARVEPGVAARALEPGQQRRRLGVGDKRLAPASAAARCRRRVAARSKKPPPASSHSSRTATWLELLGHHLVRLAAR